MEGTHCFNAVDATAATRRCTLPVIEYSHADGLLGHRRLSSIAAPHAALRGTYFYGDYCSGTIWFARRTRERLWTPSLLMKTSMNISSFGEDLNGELYVADLSGGVYAFLETTKTHRRAVTH